MEDERTAVAEPGSPTASRRTVLMAGAGGAAAILAGCTVYGREDDATEGDADPAEAAEPGASTEDAVASAAEVEVGGGLVVSDHDVVITQPSNGVFKGFSRTCTHQGCAVTSVADGTINCPCHGSRFSIEDGSVVQAAAGLTPEQQAPLPEVAITVDGDTIRLG